MSWNYRVIRRTICREYTYGIHEVYASGVWTADPSRPSGDTLDELRADLNRMAKALDLPVLREVTGGNGPERLVEVGDE